MKMKKSLIIMSLFGSVGVFGQTSALLDTNNISAKIKSDGTLFDGIFTVPKGSGKNSIYTGNIWIGGIDVGGQLHIAGQTYAQSGADFFYGPMASNYSAASYTSTYNNVWKVDKSTINFHIANYTTGGYIVPASIANWPGNGNVSNGEAAVLAPYVDVNSNSTYDPINGDYPDMRGDQAIFFMVNDDKQAHGETGGTKLGIEVHGMAYSFASTSDSALTQTVFVNYQIINRSLNNYDSVYFGAFTDMDLGGYADDFVGSDSLLNMYYTYNGSANDVSYGNKPPAQGAVFLNHPMSKFIYYDNNSNPVNGNPNGADDFYQYLSGTWKNGTAITYGGNGTTGSVPCNFMFSGNPATGTGWTEIAAGSTPGDRRGINSAGPFNLLVGGEICVDMAYPFACDYAGSNLTSITLLRQRTQSIQTFYNGQGYNCQFLSTNVNDNNSLENLLSIYPNPFTSHTIIAFKEEQKNTTIKIMDVLGKTIKTLNFTGKQLLIEKGEMKEGIYFVQIIDGNKNVMNRKIIAQ